MASGVKCDVEGCGEFGELPINPMGGHSPTGEWQVIHTSRGIYHAHNAEHAAVVAQQKGDYAKAANAESERHAQELQQQSEALRQPPASE